MFEMLAGRPPHSPNLSRLDLLNRIASGTIPSVRSVSPQVTPAVEAILSNMTANDLSERYESAVALGEEIRHCIRTKAFTVDYDDDRSGIRKMIEGPLRRVVGTSALGPKTKSRSKVHRRRSDRELASQNTELARKVETLQDSKRQRRRIIREQLKCILHIDVADTELRSDTHSLAVRLLDISEGGAAIFVEEGLNAHSMHTLDIHSDDGRIIRTVSKVAWTRYLEKRDGFSTGVEFLGVERLARAQLGKVLSDIEQSLGL